MVATSSFDVEMAIATLLADPDRVSLELTCCLNVEQRRHAKKVAEKHPDIYCESFGLGKDRKVHLFKHKSAMSSGVSIKNTFIDDWINADRAGADERLVQSLPHNMFAQCLSAEQSAHAAQTVEDHDAAPTVEDDDVPASSSLSKDVAVINALMALSHLHGGTLMEEQVFALGTEVMIDGLIKAPSFNGSCGIVQSWDAATGRYNVLLASATASGQRWAKVKSENLQHAGFQTSML